MQSLLKRLKKWTLQFLSVCWPPPAPPKTAPLGSAPSHHAAASPLPSFHTAGGQKGWVFSNKWYPNNVNAERINKLESTWVVGECSSTILWTCSLTSSLSLIFFILVSSMCCCCSVNSMILLFSASIFSCSMRLHSACCLLNSSMCCWVALAFSSFSSLSLLGKHFISLNQSCHFYRLCDLMFEMCLLTSSGIPIIVRNYSVLALMAVMTHVCSSS